MFRRSRPAYAVDGVRPYRTSDGWDVYDGDTLAGRPAVAAAVAGLPPALEHLLSSLAVCTRDGREWTVSFGDEALTLFDLSHPGSDAFERALSAAAWTGPVERVDRAVLLFTTRDVPTADVLLARCVGVCGEVFRRSGT
ncbi:hypothetical protein [Asanoa sp. NPDC050611]|uniref:hypothetical protein n=1 Tax=Asanoa sp. NPDC050611 TaxID=3157098 RepID=UPI0033FC4293